ncbi:hypothetical protein DCS_05647 [Drechmeria coniospora]|uniref:Uncharacterized protein n=1 Tax=Drechmeria coniospora TaxID=98403 RepID=A0A151GNG6_DRECN|nr:hypothetical protein DCS_05647 [Drechmeria coniospora]KYK58630.1 hypothetical protein DCS_05647 [Drechmeria coniospora]
MHVSHLRSAWIVSTVLLGATDAASAGKRKFQLGANICSGFNTVCTGTDLACGRYYDNQQLHKVVYASQDDCFRDHGPRPRIYKQWSPPRGACVGASENCLGTDEVCGAITNATTRHTCFRFRTKGPWLQPNSQRCAQKISEPCKGTAEWCELKAESYGSVQACLNQRLPSSSAPSWFDPDAAKCENATAEACLGTTELCDRNAMVQAAAGLGGKNMQLFNDMMSSVPIRVTPRLQDAWRQYNDDKDDCIAARGRVPFSAIFSPHCDGDLASEECRGTMAWCEDDSNRGDMSVEECLKKRSTKPAKLSPWFYPQSCSEASEICQGSEGVCRKTVPAAQRADCLASRDTPYWQWKTPGTNSSDPLVLELDSGSEEYCHYHYSLMDYADEFECYAARGQDYREFSNSIFAAVVPIAEKAVLDGGAKVLQNAVLRELVDNGAMADDAVDVGKDEVRRYVSNIQSKADSMARRLVEKAIKDHQARRKGGQ